MDEAVAKVKSFAAEQWLRPFVCLCHKWGDYIFRMSNVVSMNQAGVLVEGDVVNDAGYYMRQAFLDTNLVECRCAPEDRRTAVRVVITNAQWDQVLFEISQCLLMGAKVDDYRLPMNHVDATVLKARANSEVPEDACLFVGDLFAGGFSGWSHAVHALDKHGLHIRHDRGLDKELVACHAYELTHQFDARVQRSSEAAQACTMRELRGLCRGCCIRLRSQAFGG